MELKEQLDHLDAALIANVQSTSLTPLSERERAQVNAYLVLAHAVLEEHLESMFLDHFDRLVAHFSNSMVPIECIRLAFAVAELTPEIVGTAYKKRDVVALVQNLGRKRFETRLNTNHGIKTTNIETIAKGVGLDWQSFEDALSEAIADLNTLGAKRGSAGHLSPFTDRVTSIKEEITPDDVRAWVTAAQEALTKIETHLKQIAPVFGN